MAAFQLNDLQTLDKEIQDEHQAWLIAHGIARKSEIPASCFGLLNYPELWSGNRLGETSIQKPKDSAQHASIGVQSLISRKKKQYQERFLDAEVPRYQQLEKDYNQFLDQLKERFLALAIENTLAKIPANAHTTDLRNFYQAAERSPVNFQTQDQCVAEHARITKIIQATRKHLSGDDLKNLEQLEILSKRKLDIHYENATKKTKVDKTLDGITATTSTIGLVTGIAAAGCVVFGFLFPPLWAAVPILGYISFASYAGTAINVGRMAKNGVNGRPPSMEQTKELARDAALAPLNVLGSVFRGISHFFKASKIIKAMSITAKVTNNVVSNVMDVPFVKDIADEGTDAINNIRAKKLAHSTSTTTTAKISSLLLAEHSVAKVETTVNTLANSLKKEPLVLAKITNNKEGITLATSVSQHDVIANWKFGFINSRKYRAELQFIQATLDKYKQLPVNATYEDRFSALHEMKGECQNFMAEIDNEPALIKSVEALQKAVVNELQNLTTVVEGEQLPNKVEEEVLNARPMLVGR